MLDPRNLDPRVFLEQGRLLGIREQTLRRVSAAIIGRDEQDPAAWTLRCQAPSRLVEAIAPPLPRLKLVGRRASPRDGFVKLLFETRDGLRLETVLIPLHKPGAVSICLSSQVGCPVGCAFCATGRMSTRRNLETWEIVDQLIQARAEVQAGGRRVTGAVFMGMGEPFLNYDRVMAAAEILGCPFGGAIAGPAITVSTVGLVSEIDRFTREQRRFRLSISLIAATDDKRRAVAPHLRATPLKAIMAAARRHAEARRTRVMLAYVCISGFNMSEDDARALASLVDDTPVRLDLIDVTDPTGRFHPPAASELHTFRDALSRELRQPVVRRYSGGADILAACGTLAGVG